jgi:ABC-type Fe3+-hydroxamate transport system substrate-binding protein
LFNTSFPKKYILLLLIIIFISYYQYSYTFLQAKNISNAIKDVGGFAHTAGDYKRIITLSPNLTEICLALELKNRLAGVSVASGCSGIENIKKIDGWNVNYETILLLKPDLILTTSAGNPRQVIERLRELGLNVFHTEQAGLDGIFETIEKIGALTKTSEKADDIVASMKKELEQLKRNLPTGKTKPRVLYLLWTDPPMAPGGDTFLSEMIAFAGGQNIFESSNVRIVKPSIEKIIELDPEVIFLPQGVNFSDFDERWMVISAVKIRNVFHVNEDFVLRPGINTIKGIGELAGRIRSSGKKDKR